MTRNQPTPHREQAERLRHEIVADLRALHRSFTIRLPDMGGSRSAGHSASGGWKALPEWIAGTIAGIMAGAWMAMRRRSPRSTSDAPSESAR